MPAELQIALALISTSTVVGGFIFAAAHGRRSDRRHGPAHLAEVPRYIGQFRASTPRRSNGSSGSRGRAGSL